jgi:hypothetical protein
MPSQTHFKLAEASFFLLKAAENSRNVPDFDFYLSAFFAAARSVTWVMKAEYGDVPGWTEWYDGKQPDARTEGLLRKIADLRNRSQKFQPIKTRTTPTLNIPSVTPEVMEALSEAKEIRLDPVDARNEEFFIWADGKRIAAGRLKEAKHELREFPGEHALAPCERYIEFLHEVVAECESKFTPISNGI